MKPVKRPVAPAGLSEEFIMQLSVLLMFGGIFLFLVWFFNSIVTDIFREEP
jgi:hypothetical protein